MIIATLGVYSDTLYSLIFQRSNNWSTGEQQEPSVPSMSALREPNNSSKLHHCVHLMKEYEADLLRKATSLRHPGALAYQLVPLSQYLYLD